MEERIRAEFLEILKRVLSDLHQKKYKNILKYVDTQDDFDLLDFLENDLEDTLEDYGYEALDEYGTLDDEDDKIERLDIYEFNDGTGFSIDYFLSADQELTDLVLQLDFLYTNKSPKGIRCVFRDIDYR